jgi:hypothetical protein
MLGYDTRIMLSIDTKARLEESQVSTISEFLINERTIRIKFLSKISYISLQRPDQLQEPHSLLFLHSSRALFLGDKADLSPASISEGKIIGAISPLDLHKTSSCPTLHEVVARTACLV